MNRGIIVRFDPPPIVPRSHDWFAVQTGFDAEIDPIGYGGTPDEAIADLNEKIMEREDARN